MQDQAIEQRSKELLAQMQQLERDMAEILEGLAGSDTVPKEWFWASSAHELLTNKMFALSGLPPIGEDIMRMDFGQALRALKAGHRVSRAGWNGKGMWIALSPGSKQLPAERFWAPQNRRYAEENGPTDVLPCITMKTATGEILMGWLASQTDMLAEDWQLAPSAGTSDDATCEHAANALAAAAAPEIPLLDAVVHEQGEARA